MNFEIWRVCSAPAQLGFIRSVGCCLVEPSLVALLPLAGPPTAVLALRLSEPPVPREGLKYQNERMCQVFCCCPIPRFDQSLIKLTLATGYLGLIALPYSWNLLE